MNEKNLKTKRKFKPSKWLIVGGFLLIIIGILSVMFYSIVNNPKYVIKQSVIRTFAIAENFKNVGGHDMQFGTSIKLGGNLVEDVLSDDTLNVRGFVDFTNNKLQLTGNLSEDNKKILSGSVLYNNDGTYIASDNLFDNTYNINNYDCSNSDDFICTFLKWDNSSVNLNDIGLDEDVSLEKAIEGFKEAVLNSVNSDNVYRNKGTVKDDFAKYNKYTYKLDKDTINYIYNNLNDSAKYYLYSALYMVKGYSSFSEVESEIKESLENITDPIEINIYTSGVLNKFAGIEIGNSSTPVSLSYIAESKKFNFSLPKSKIRVEGVEGSDKKLAISVYRKEILLGTFYYDNKDDTETIEGKVSFLGMTLNINTTNKKNISKDKDLTGLLNVNLGLDTFIYNLDFNLAVDYNYSNNITMSSLDTQKAIDYNEMSQEEKDKMQQELDNFTKTKVGKIFDFFGGNSDLEDEFFSDSL